MAAFVIAISLLQPWVVASEVPTMLPARAMGEFFADSFQRRTGQKLRAVAGDPQLAALIGRIAHASKDEAARSIERWDRGSSPPGALSSDQSQRNTRCPTACGSPMSSCSARSNTFR